MTGPLVDRLLAGDPRALARALSLVEDETAEGVAIIRAIFPRTGRAELIGITGPPGAGKSTLVDQLVRLARGRRRRVGVLAVDPTSPYSGGAILGDRVRMQAHASDPGVFIRSMATRGQLGGLARTTGDAALVLDAAGCDLIFIETVGVGQDEVDIVRAADVSVVVLVPGTGDDVQALKAGIMEIADLFVVNKADREGADRTVAAVESVLGLQAYAPDEWRPPVLRTEATSGEGTAPVLDAVAACLQSGAARSEARRRVRAEWRLRTLLTGRFLHRVEHDLLPAGAFDAIVSRIVERELDPHTAADAIMRGLSKT